MGVLALVCNMQSRHRVWMLHFCVCLHCLCSSCPSVTPLALCCHIVVWLHETTTSHRLYMLDESLLVMSTTAGFPSNSRPSLQRPWSGLRPRPWVLHHFLALKLTQQQHLFLLRASFARMRVHFSVSRNQNGKDVTDTLATCQLRFHF